MVIMTREAAAAAWRRASEERAFWSAHRQEFLNRFPDQFVAVKNGDVVATGTNLDEIVARLAERGLEPTEVWLHYFNSHPGSSFF